MRPDIFTVLARPLAFSLLLSAASAAMSATFYVDAARGDDALTGLAAAASGSDGPWRTLARVNAAALQPGDQVLLRCGQAWNETLSLMTGGSVGNPITVGAFPYGCANKPALSGWQTVQADDWELYSGKIYRLRLPVNALPNGRMATNVAGWRSYSGSGDHSFAYSAACPGGVACGVFATGVNGGLLISPSVALRKGQGYTMRAQVLVPAGAGFGATVRRFTAPYAMQTGYSQWTGTGDWQDVSFSFVAPANVDDGRVDIDLPGARRTSYLRNVRIESSGAAPAVVHVASSVGVMNTAAHPNMGYRAAAPTSPYLSAQFSAVATGADGRTGSAYISTGSDLVLPAGASITPGLSAWVRSQAWSVREHKVTSFAGGRIYLDRLTPYPLSYPGWGYFLTGALWMLDSPGEWFYDAAGAALYAWMPDGAAPGTRLKVGTLAQAVQIGNPSIGKFPGNIVLENLAINGVGAGLNFARMANITLRGLAISEVAGFGVYAEGTSKAVVQDSSFSNTRADAMFVYGDDARITNNEVVNSGVIVDSAGTIKSLPRENFSAIMGGPRAVITGNRVINAGYIGIQAGGNDATVADNVVVGYSWVLNDSGGLYSAGTTGQTITGNLVVGGVGSRDGIPSVIQTQAPGIYLDDFTVGTLLRDNVFGSADYCIQLHNASSNTIENNSCFDSRRSPLFIQETSSSKRAAGDVFGNVVRGNAWFQTGTAPAVAQQSNRSDVFDFASFEGNHYASLATPIVAQESAPGYSRSFTLKEWQAAAGSAGAARGLEATGTSDAPLQRYARGTPGVSLVPGLTSTNGGWSPNGSTTSLGLTCGPGATPCLVVTAPAASGGYVSSPRFALSKGAWYRVSFDAYVGASAQTVTAMVMRSGPTYENLMGAVPLEFNASGTWKRYAFYFQASADALRSDTSAGARLDFMNIPAAGTLGFANVEVTPLLSGTVQPYVTTLFNGERVDQSFTCPLVQISPVSCTKFFEFPAGTRVVWPVTVAPRKARMVFTQDDSLPDADGDGVPDSADRCPATPQGQAVNAAGCGIGQ